MTTVVVVEVGGGTGSATVVVRLTVVVVVVVGGGVETTSSLVQAPQEIATPINRSTLDSVFMMCYSCSSRACDESDLPFGAELARDSATTLSRSSGSSLKTTRIWQSWLD